jgi:hypothetical protein
MSDLLATAMTKIIEILTPLDSEQRRRVMQAAFALLGEEPVLKTHGRQPAAKPEDGTAEEAIEGINATASSWLAKAKITQEHLEQHLHFDGGAVKVISLPGNATKRIDQVVHTYLMRGLAAFLATGEASFSDKDARDLCEHFGCYDATNHAKYIKEFGNRITGSKNAGWKLTAPGLTAAADLLKA